MQVQLPSLNGVCYFTKELQGIFDSAMVEAIADCWAELPMRDAQRKAMEHNQLWCDGYALGVRIYVNRN